MKTIWNWLVSLVKSKAKKKLPKVEDIKPTPEAKGCGCDLSKLLTVPLVPLLGNNDRKVNDELYNRWRMGIDDACGGLPGDVRPLLWRPTGRTFGWKDVILSGAIRIQLNGERMTLWCGNYKGQRLHLIGASDNEAPASGARPETLPDFVPMKSGVEGPKKHFVYFECREGAQ